MAKSKVSPLVALPRDGQIHYLYPGHKKPDVYDRDAYWDGPTRLVITTRPQKGHEDGTCWVKVLTVVGGNRLRGEQVCTGKTGGEEQHPIEAVEAEYYLANQSVPMVAGGNAWPSHKPPVTLDDALDRRCVWWTRVPLRPSV